MAHVNRIIADLLQSLDLGSSVAESDNLLGVARVETSGFTDLYNDRVDLIPGTKGSGKSALFRIFVDFLPDHLLRQRKVVVAHGVQSPGDPVFHAFIKQFSNLNEQEFVSFWCIYLVSLAHEQFIKGQQYADYLSGASTEIKSFREACQAAKIPEIKARKSLREILEWGLHVLASWRPSVSYKLPHDSGEIQLDFFRRDNSKAGKVKATEQEYTLPKYINDIKHSLDQMLDTSQLSLWLMIDRLDEIFPRRSRLERIALRGLLRAMRFFSSQNIRVKIFLRDDMLDQVVRGEEGFTALTHITVRQSDTLRWTEEQILSMIVKRIFANPEITSHLDINMERLNASTDYRTESFYKFFPPTVHRGLKQSATLRWIYNRCADGKGVVTPRDVLDLLIRAKQKQHDMCVSNTGGTTDWMIGSSALQYGLQELSKRKKQTYLEAEFPHLWKNIEKFIGGKTEYDEKSMGKVLGKGWKDVADDLVSIGLFSLKTRNGKTFYWVPFLYRHGLDLTQGKA